MKNKMICWIGTLVLMLNITQAARADVSISENVDITSGINAEEVVYEEDKIDFYDTMLDGSAVQHSQVNGHTF